jgi:undecaprenyl-diphosphatase
MESPIRVSPKLMLVQQLISQIDVQESAVNRRMLEIAVLFAVVLSCWTLIATDEISASQTLLQSDWLLVARPFFEAITDLFLYVFYLLFAGLLILGFAAQQALLRGLAWRYLLAQLIGSVIVVRVLNSDLPGEFTGEWGAWTLDAGFHAMPSGHSADVFTGAVLLALVLKSAGLRSVLLASAVLAGFSRVAVAAHWPSDVLVGGLIGSCCAYGLIRLYPLRSS